MHERTPLIDPDDLPKQHLQFVFTSYTETLRLARMTLPISLSFAMQNVVQAWSILMAGTLGSMVAIGGATALDTLGGQAFTITNRGRCPHILGIYLQRCLLILCALFTTIIIPIWWFSGQLFVLCGQEQDFAMATGTFLRILIPGGILQVVAECLKKYLQFQGQRKAVSYIIAVSTLIGVLLSYVLFRLAKTGLWGAPLAASIYHLTTSVLLLAFIYSSKTINEAWGGFSKQAFAGLSRAINLALTGIMTVASEWWSFEILAMMAAKLDSNTTSAQSILMASDLIFTTVSLGLGVAASHRIGNLLGSDNAAGVRYAVWAPYLLSILLGAVEFFVIAATRHKLGYLFSNDCAVVELTARILPLMVGFQILDLANGGAGGILRGVGKNHLSGMCNFVAYYGLGLTTAWLLCFQQDLGLLGLWMGIIIGSGALLVLQTLCVMLVRWEDEAHKAVFAV